MYDHDTVEKRDVNVKESGCDGKGGIGVWIGGTGVSWSVVVLENM